MWPPARLCWPLQALQPYRLAEHVLGSVLVLLDSNLLN